MVFSEADQWAMEARWQGATHRIELNGKLDYTGPSFRARLNPETFEVEQAEVTGGAKDSGLLPMEPRLSLEPCAAMFVLLAGLQQSMPHLPSARTGNTVETGSITHPGYRE